MSGDFTHLHLHTTYSLLDGAIRLDDLFPKILADGMKQVAMTDHGNLFGAVDFYKKAKKYGVKPIFGCETYVSATEMTDKTSRNNYHLILLAKNKIGYQNLSYLNSMGFLHGFYYNPRIDKKILREHSQGLIGMSACLGGEVAKTVMRQGVEKAKEVAKEYASIFEPDSYFLEVMPNGLEEQEKVNDAVRTISRDTGIGAVATNDCHYVNRGDYKAHDILMCIQQKKTVHDERRLHHKQASYYIKTPQEMETAFSDWPEVLENTARIGDMCNVELELGKNMLPQYEVPEGFDLNSYLEEVTLKGLHRRFEIKQARKEAFDPDIYRERMKTEIGVVKKMGFSGYFLIVWDFIRWAKEHKIPVGPGRGSGAGSVVAWALSITDVDPIPYKLLFERFLNPDRVSMPDFDIDFCMNRRDEVIGYVTDKYGKDNVGQIATFHQLRSRGCVRDVARALGISISEADKVAKLVPEPRQGKPPAIDEAIEEEPRLKEMYENDPRVKEWLDYAKRLEGLNRHVGMHAAGVVIAERPLWELVPCFKGENGEIVTQFAKDEVEAAGLIKFDFLGLKTLTVIDTAIKLVNQRRAEGEELLEMDVIPLDDPAVYQLIASGKTTGLFQLESSGMREMLKKLAPDNIEDVVAAVALYRPGPLKGGMVDDFIDRKHGKKAVVYPHVTLQSILEDTYGVIVYQEQVMQIAQAMAGYTLGQADILRRAMGKKKAKEMAEQRAMFLQGAQAREIDGVLAGEVFDLMAFFAEYGFNRSHSVAYAMLTYQTAYLKTHHPHEFMAGLLSCDRDNTDNIVKFIAEARLMDIKVERPDVNQSDMDFTVVEQDGVKVIRFGLGAVKGVGEGAVEQIIGSRTDDGPFVSLYDFCRRADTQRVNRRVVDALVKAGAFDGIAGQKGPNRAQHFGTISAAFERGVQAQKDLRSGQTSLFALTDTVVEKEDYPELEEWPPKELLAFEKESLGFYITGHPLDRFQGDISRYATTDTGGVGEYASREDEVSMGGVVTAYRDKQTRAGTGRVAFFDLEDQFGKISVIVFPKVYARLYETLTSDEPLLCTGRVKFEDSDRPKMFLDQAIPLARARAECTSQIHVILNADVVSKQAITDLKEVLGEYRGHCQSFVHLKIPMRSETVVPLGDQYNVEANDDLLMRLERLFGDGCVILR